MLKTTALVSVISGTDLMTNIQLAYSQNFKTIPLLLVASLWYLGLTSIMSVGQYYLERHFGRASARKRARPPKSARTPRHQNERRPTMSSPDGQLTTPAPVVPATEAPMVRAEQVWKSFGKLDVLKGVDLTVYRRQTYVLLGPSGGGKSTMLRCINHLEQIDAGRLYVDGDLMGYRERGDKLHEMRLKDVAKQRAKIGMVFQRFNLFRT